MPSELIHDPGALIAALGGLHDVEINRLEFDTGEQTVVLSVDDINANFTETTEYQGCRPCSLVLRGVEGFRFDINSHEGIRISDACIIRNGPKSTLELDLNIGGGSSTEGRRSITISFREMQIDDKI